MNKQTQEALKMAIEALDTLMMEKGSIYQQALQACKEALAELEQQPKVTGFIRTLETVDKDGIETWKLEPFFTLQSLQEHDNKVIEKCAKEVENLRDGICIAEIIRALKGKQNESALERMAENARELGLDYCSHGSDSACKECYMEKTK